MINIKASKNWNQARIKNHKKYVWDTDEANRLIYNDLPMHEADIVEEKYKKVNDV